MCIYMSDVRRLARLAKIENDDVIRCAFICGLPSDVPAQLRISTTINTMDMSVVVEQARVLMSDRLHGAMAAHAKYASTRSGTGIPTPRPQHADGNHRMSDDQNLSSDREHPVHHFPSRECHAKRWIDASAKKSTGCVSIKAIHDVHHLGIDRTHYLAKLEDPEVTRGKVADVINSCTQCQSIDPAPQNWNKGHLSAIAN